MSKPVPTVLCLTFVVNSFCISGIGRRIHCNGHRVWERCRTRRFAGSCTSIRQRWCYLLSLQDQWIPRLIVCTCRPSVLSRLPNQWQCRLHLWLWHCCFPKLCTHCQEKCNRQNQRGHSTWPICPKRLIGLLLPIMQDLCRPRFHRRSVSWSTLGWIFTDGIHTIIYKQCYNARRLAWIQREFWDWHTVLWWVHEHGARCGACRPSQVDGISCDCQPIGGWLVYGGQVYWRELMAAIHRYPIHTRIEALTLVIQCIFLLSPKSLKFCLCSRIQFQFSQAWKLNKTRPRKNSKHKG